MSQLSMNGWSRERLLVLAAFLAVSCAGSAPLARPAATLRPISSTKPAEIALTPAPSLGETVLSPISLIAPDGTKLPLIDIQAKVTIADPLATTELRLTFENGSTNGLDARLSLSLPGGATVRRLAMRRPTPAASRVDGKSAAVVETWAEALLADRGRVHATYDDVLGARMEAELFGNGAEPPFIAGVGPIEPSSKTQVQVTYDEVLRGDYRLRLRGIPKLATLSARVDNASESSPLSEIALRDEAPSGDLIVPEARFHNRTAANATGVSGDGTIAVRVPVGGSTTTEPLLSPIFLCDTSAYRAVDLDKEVAMVGELARRMPADTEITIVAYDQEAAPVYQGRAAGLDEKVLAELRSRRGLGASDLSSALGWVGRASLSQKGLHHRLVVFTDGRVSAGERNPLEIAKLAKELGAQGIDRADVVALGAAFAPSPENAIVSALTHDAELPWRGVVVDIDRGAEQIERRLTRPVLSPLSVTVDGASFVWPTRVDNAEAGDDLVVLAELPKGTAPSIHVGADALRPTMHEVAGGLVDRALGVAKINALMAQRDLARADKRALVVAVSQKRSVPSPFSEWTLPVDAAKSPTFHNVAIEMAFRQHDIDVVDAPPVESGTGAIDPLDASLKTLPHVEVAKAPPEKESKKHTVAKPASVSSFDATEPNDQEPTDAPTVKSVVDGVSGRLPAEIIQRTVRLNHGRFRGCYQQAISQRPKIVGRLVVSFVIEPSGDVSHAENASGDIHSLPFIECVKAAFSAISFPAVPDGRIFVKYPLVFSDGDSPPPPHNAVAVKYAAKPAPEPPEPEPQFNAPYSGPYEALMNKLAHHDASALADASAWQARAPFEVLSYLALGEAAEQNGNQELAARAYGSILALWSYRADLARTAGERLGRVGSDGALRIACDAFATARDDRPDQPTGYRLLAFAEYRVGRPEEAFRVLERALNDNYDNDRFVGARLALGQDLGLLAAAWARSSPERRPEIERRTSTAGGRIQTEPSMRIALLWETNTTDVDLHVGDGAGEFVSRKKHSLSGGGELHTDVVDGYGPELFSVASAVGKRNYPYSVRVAYRAHGSLGFGTGTVEMVEHDGKGHLRFDDRPFVVMNDRTGIELGDFREPATR